MPDIYTILAGHTKKFTWVSSGASASNTYVAIVSGSETLVSSTAMTSSGNGHYYVLVTMPNTQGFYTAKSYAEVSTYPFRKNKTLQVVLGQVD